MSNRFRFLFGCVYYCMGCYWKVLTILVIVICPPTSFFSPESALPILTSLSGFLFWKNLFARPMAFQALSSDLASSSELFLSWKPKVYPGLASRATYLLLLLLLEFICFGIAPLESLLAASSNSTLRCSSC